MENSAEISSTFTPYIQANHSDQLINEMWQKGFGLWISSAVAFSLFLFGFPLNAWVLWLILKDPGGLVASDIFTLNLAAMEMCYCLAAPLYGFSVFFSRKPMLMLMCFFDGLILAGQPLFQCCICVERYLAVVHPFIYLKYKPVRYRATCSGTVWMLAIGCGGFCLFDYGLALFSLLALCVVVLAVGLFCSFFILKALMQPGPGEGETEGMNLMKKKAFTIILIGQTFMMVSYIPLPFVVIASSINLIPLESLNIAFEIVYAFFMTGALVQPLLYLTRAGKLPCLH